VLALIWLLLLLPLLAGFLAQNRVRAVFARYRAVPNHAGLTGAQLARAMLDAHGLSRVGLQVAPGFLTDHYDPGTHVLRLSAPVARERSVAALGIAAHEASHAYQDAEGSRAYRVRRSVGEPLMRLAPWSGLFFIGGFLFGVPVLMVLSIAYVAGLVLFAVATVPVELGASHRAVAVLRRAGLADAGESEGIRRVLGAAALTYLANVLRQIGFFLALVAISETATRVGS
jgi:uncharacterized protein